MYSVSPRRKPKSFGGKNSENRSTRIPTALATAMCPSSCSTIKSTMPRIVRIQLIGASVAGPRRASGREPRHQPPRERPRLTVGLIERLEGPHRRRPELGERLPDHLGDLQE